MTAFVPMVVVPAIVLLFSRAVVAASLVHEAIPRTITVHRVSHCLISGVLFSTGLTSFQNVSSLTPVQGPLSQNLFVPFNSGI